MFEKYLPLSIEGDWCTSTTKLPQRVVTPKLLDWLLENGSLTQKLKNHCGEFSVKVLAKNECMMTPQQSAVFTDAGHATTKRVQIREVLLYCDGVAWVYGQTLMPLDGVPKSINQLITLGEKPLGELIFNQPGVKRSELEVAYFDSNAPISHLAEQINQPVVHGLCGRRSLFSLDGYSLSVSEIFLPAAGLYS